MLSTISSTKQFLIPQSGSSQREENERLRQRINELEEELMQVYQELIRERQHAYIDPLTGIPNRHAYQARLSEERKRARRNDKSMCLVIWDIDHFKTINDRYGHQMGDKVLACVAKMITQRLRGSDFTARFGGEEFVSILPDCEIESALQFIDQLRREIAYCDQVSEQGRIEVTLSCGIAKLDPEESDRKLFARADVALYRAKSQGRNRVCLADNYQA